MEISSQVFSREDHQDLQIDWMWQEKEKEKSRITLDVFSLII